MSFSPVLRVRKFLDKMKSERGDISPIVGRLKRSPPSRSSSSEFDSSTSLIPQTKLGRKSSGSKSQGHTPVNVAEFMELSFDGQTYESQFLSQVFQATHKLNPFDNLPDEAILDILSFLDAKSLINLRYVSKELSALADDHLIWKHLCARELGVQVTLENCNWKTTYLVLESMFREGDWTGFSKWVDPPSFDNEQRTNARLNFLARVPAASASTSPHSSSAFQSPSRSNSASSDDATASANSSPHSSIILSASGKRDSASEHGDAHTIKPHCVFKIVGTGVTVNCESPSPFGIRGERVSMDGNGMKFIWNKQFDKHTSVYEGYMNFRTRTVEGTISYHDGHTQWKGIFYYARCIPSSPKLKPNSTNIKRKSSKRY